MLVAFHFGESSGRDTCMTMRLEDYFKDICLQYRSIEFKKKPQCIGKEKVFTEFYCFFVAILSQRQVNEKTKFSFL